jgi:hypothetical protein
MKTRRLCAALWAAIAVAALPADALDWSQPWVFVHDSQAAADAGDEYAWRAFVAVNWPADLRTRGADPRRDLSANTTAVWETWQNVKDVFLLGGADPGPWQQRVSVAESFGRGRFDVGSFLPSVPARHVVNGVMVTFDPIADARHLNETRLNRAVFEYIHGNELYNLDGQLALFRRGIAPSFPADSVEVKAQWRPIKEEQRPRYHTVTVSLADGSRRLYGLTALHIASKDAANWFWATFEHVDNEAGGASESWVRKSEDRFACQQVAPDCNRAPSAIGLEGTVWQNYRLRGTMVRPLDEAGRVNLLANSHLEAGVQRTASCITCHARASIGVIDGQAARLSVLNLRAAPLAGDSSRGYVGEPDPAWFFPADSRTPTERLYLPLDFVWSLAKAQPRSSP